jgi:hypothetical protein
MDARTKSHMDDTSQYLDDPSRMTCMADTGSGRIVWQAPFPKTEYDRNITSAMSTYISTKASTMASTTSFFKTQRPSHRLSQALKYLHPEIPAPTAVDSPPAPPKWCKRGVKPSNNLTTTTNIPAYTVRNLVSITYHHTLCKLVQSVQPCVPI